MTTRQEIPRGGHFDVVVIIGEPVAEGYPVAPPSAARFQSFMLFISAILVLFLVLTCVLLSVISTPHRPRFKVESISVALDKGDIFNNQSEAVRATWDVRFSIKNLPGREITVSVRCMSSNWSANIIEGDRKTTSVDAVVITLLPREFVLPELIVGGLTLHHDVLFWTDHRGDMVEGVCKNMIVAFSPNATRGIMVGGQRSCHVHQRKCHIH